MRIKPEQTSTTMTRGSGGKNWSASDDDDGDVVPFLACLSAAADVSCFCEDAVPPLPPPLLLFVLDAAMTNE